MDGQKDYGFAIVAGIQRCAAPNSVYVGVDGTNVVMSRAPFSFCPSHAPVSAVVAANSAVAEAYKHFTPLPGICAVENAVLELPAVEDMDIGRVLLVGAGGISHGLAWVLQWLGWRGLVIAVDFDPIEPSNLNRYFCAFVDDVGAEKPAMLSSFLGKTRLGARLVLSTWFGPF